MTHERYMELNALADRLIASRHCVSAADLNVINGLTMRERAVLNCMVFRCLVCNEWFDCSAMWQEDNRSRKCGTCGPFK